MTLLPAIKKLSIYVVVLLVVDVIFSFVIWLIDERGAPNLDGTYNEPGSLYIIKSLLMSLVIIFPLVSALLGVVIAIFIHPNYPYGERFFKATLLVLTIIYSLLSIGSIWQLGMHLSS